jgi:hypothetical protein
MTPNIALSIAQSLGLRTQRMLFSQPVLPMVLCNVRDIHNVQRRRRRRSFAYFTMNHKHTLHWHSTHTSSNRMHAAAHLGNAAARQWLSANRQKHLINRRATPISVQVCRCLAQLGLRGLGKNQAGCWTTAMMNARQVLAARKRRRQPGLDGPLTRHWRGVQKARAVLLPWHKRRYEQCIHTGMQYYNHGVVILSIE